MFEQPNFRRRDDGSIDIDFYRQAGLSERRLVMTDFARGLRKALRGVVAVLLLAATVYMAPSAINARPSGTVLEPLPNSAQVAAPCRVSPAPI